MLHVLNFWSLHQPFGTLFLWSILYSDDRSNNNNRIVCFPVDWGHKGIFCYHRNYDSDSIFYIFYVLKFEYSDDGTENFAIVFRSVRGIWWYGSASMHLHYASVFLFSYFEWHLQLCIRSRSEHLIVSIIFFWYPIYFEWFKKYL